MKPLDARLLRYAGAARAFLVASAFVALVQTVAIVGFAWFAGHAIASLVQGAPLAAIAPNALAALGCALVRGLTAWADRALAARSAADVKSALRQRALAALAGGGAGVHSSDAATRLGRGLDALDGYFGDFLPQFTRTLVQTPIIVVALLFGDLFTGIVVIVCLPLIPVFMALIGMATERVQRRQWRATERLSRDFLEVLEGIATLKIFRRDRRAATRIAASSDEHRRRTMQVLRISFVSSMVLELAATLSVALVAVSIGIRLTEGNIALSLAFVLLILTPDAFLPIRMVGGAFHASTEGLEASGAVLDMIESEQLLSPPSPAAGAGLVLREFRADREEPLPPVTLHAAPGTVTVFAGASGVGKSSTFTALLQLVPSLGSAGLDSAPVERHDLAWAPQASANAVATGTVRDNVAFGLDVDDGAIESVLHELGLDVSLDTPIEAARGGQLALSGGQVQRVVLARALLRARAGARVLLADEPTSALDAASEALVVAALAAQAQRGTIVVVASHRAALVSAADTVVRLEAVQV